MFIESINWSARRIAHVLFAVTATAWSIQPVLAGPLEVDHANSEVGISFKQLGVSVDASFKKFSAKLSLDPNNLADAKADILIDTGSFDLGPGAEEYNAEVAAPTWFDTQKFPQARFVSEKVVASGAGKFQVSGSLTIKGTTLPLVVPFVLMRDSSTWFFSGEVSINRLDYKIGQGEWASTSLIEDAVVISFKIKSKAP